MIDIPGSKWGKKTFYTIYWLVYLLVFGFAQAGPYKDFKNAFASELISLPVRILFVAIVLEVLVEQFLEQKKIIQFIVFYIPLILVSAVLVRWIDNTFILEYFLTDWNKEPIFSISIFIYTVIKLQFVVTIPICIKLFFNWMQERHRAMTIAEEKAQAELVILRNQFHPHFIFNVLNTLYAKSVTTSPETAEIISRMSSLLRFSIYEIDSRQIPLEKEIQYLEDYIELQKARFDQHVQISFHTEGELSNKWMEPFMLMVFVENCFKHLMPNEQGESWITIWISFQNGWLSARFENSAEIGYSGHIHNHSEGVGLENVKRRLSLLYKNNHILRINQNDYSYFVNLKLKLETNGRTN